MTLLELVGVAVAGGVVGIVAGMFGVGGGFLVVPALSVFFGQPIEIAVGAGSCQALGPATAALLARRPTRETFRLPLVLFGGLMCGVVSGAMLLETVATLTASGDDAGKPLAELVVLVTYLVLLAAMGAFAVWESRRSARGRPIRRGWLRELTLPPCAVFPDIVHQRLSLPVLTWFALAVGFLSGLLGISGGLLMIPALVYLFGIPVQDAIRNSLVIVFLVSLQSTAVHAWNENVDLSIVSALLVGGTFGARLGTRIGTRLRGPGLRQRFGWLLLATAGLIAYRLVRL